MFYHYANTIYHKSIKNAYKRFKTHLNGYLKNSKIRPKIKFSLICIQFPNNGGRLSLPPPPFKEVSVVQRKNPAERYRQKPPNKKSRYISVPAFHQYHYSTLYTAFYCPIYFTASSTTCAFVIFRTPQSPIKTQKRTSCHP